MRYLLLGFILILGCGIGPIDSRPIEIDEDCEQIGVCTELSPLLYDRPEDMEFVIVKDGKIILKSIELLRFTESHCDKNSSSETTVTCWLDWDASAEGFTQSRMEF